MNNDLISRSELKEAFKAWKTTDDYYHNTDCNDIPLSEAFDLIDNAPTVEVPENAINCVLTMFGECSYNETGCHDCEIKAKIRKALAERPQGEWIPVSERLPEVSQRCLVYTKYDEVMTDFFMGDEFMDNGFMQGADIIAWRPLPEPYKEGGAENDK